MNIKSIIIGAFIGAFIGMSYHCYDTNQEYKDLANRLAKVQKDHKALIELYELQEKDFNMIWEENQLFSSMLGSIEGEPGGSEILQALFDEFHNHEIE